MKSPIEDQDLELIENVLGNKASKEELAIFDQRMKEDITFANRVEIIKTLQTHDQHDSDEFESTLNEIHAEINKDLTTLNTSKKSGIKGYYLSIAAAIALLIVAIFLLKPFNQHISTEELYAANFSIPAENIITRDQIEIDSDLMNAINAYNSGDFKNAIPYFDKYLQKDSSNIGAQFYHAISLLADNHSVAGIAKLNNLLERKEDSIYHISAKWYLGLGYLQSGDEQNAKIIFESIADSSSSYSLKATKILNSLRK